MSTIINDVGESERRNLLALSAWYDAMDGKLSFSEALKEVCASFGAEALGVSRYRDRDGGRPRFVCYDRRPRDAHTPKLVRAYTHCVLGEFARRARTGTVWQSSAVSDLDPALTTFQSRRALRELIVCPLANAGDSRDYLEVHFSADVAGKVLARIETTALSLSRAWGSREPGQFFERIVDSTPAAGAGDFGDLLALENPAGLSRAEYRVCLLFSQGLSKEFLLRELCITEATLRTHLRNIYLKVGVENKAELVYRLLSARTSAPPRRARHTA